MYPCPPTHRHIVSGLTFSPPTILFIARHYRSFSHAIIQLALRHRHLFHRPSLRQNRSSLLVLHMFIRQDALPSPPHSIKEAAPWTFPPATFLSKAFRPFYVSLTLIFTTFSTYWFLLFSLSVLFYWLLDGSLLCLKPPQCSKVILQHPHLAHNTLPDSEWCIYFYAYLTKIQWRRFRKALARYLFKTCLYTKERMHGFKVRVSFGTTFPAVQGAE